MKSVLVIGAGQFGTHIAQRMEELHCEVMAIDIDEDSINDILPYVTDAKIGDGTNEDFLRSADTSRPRWKPLLFSASLEPKG